MNIMNVPNEEKQFIISAIIFLLFTLLHLYTTGKYEKLIRLFITPIWFISFIIIVIWCIYVFKYHQQKGSEKVKETTKKAIIAFIIAILSSSGISIAVFWFVWIATYYLSDWK